MGHADGRGASSGRRAGSRAAPPTTCTSRSRRARSTGWSTTGRRWCTTQRQLGGRRQPVRLRLHDRDAADDGHEQRLLGGDDGRAGAEGVDARADVARPADGVAVHDHAGAHRRVAGVVDQRRDELPVLRAGREHRQVQRHATRRWTRPTPTRVRRRFAGACLPTVHGPRVRRGRAAETCGRSTRTTSRARNGCGATPIAGDSIQSAPYYDTARQVLHFGTERGRSSRSARPGCRWPGIRSCPDLTSDSIRAALLYINGILAVGTTTGKLYFFDRNNGDGAGAASASTTSARRRRCPASATTATRSATWCRRQIRRRKTGGCTTST